ncbi:MAG: hypothetical protein ACYSX1_06490 [Planctomycetota bacterium]|jgi:hypothetical protein
MSAEVLKIVIPAILVLAVVLVAGYFIIRYMRGSIKITLAKEGRGDKTRTRTREIYRDELTIEEAKTFPSGQTMNYDFELATPSSAGPDFLSSPLGKTLKVGMEMLSGRRSYLRWIVEVRLDAKGVDLASREKITLNMSKVT